MFALRTGYHSGTYIHVRLNFSEWQVEHPCGQHALRRKEQAGADGTIAAFHGGFDFFFQVYGGLTYLRDPQVHRALF